MTAGAGFPALDWSEIELVAFDVDGTLYDQGPLRLKMARDMGLHALRTRSMAVPTIIRNYRHLREELGDSETADFEPHLLARTARQSGASIDEVSRIAEEWINRRPLPYLGQCRFAGVSELFAALRRRGKAIGVISDYPALAKLAALGLRADMVVSATDPDVGILKPHPKGLCELMKRVSAHPTRTLLIGDRVERDGVAAKRAGVRSLIRTRRLHSEFQTFRRYDDPVFSSVLEAGFR